MVVSVVFTPNEPRSLWRGKLGVKLEIGTYLLTALYWVLYRAETAWEAEVRTTERLDDGGWTRPSGMILDITCCWALEGRESLLVIQPIQSAYQYDKYTPAHSCRRIAV